MVNSINALHAVFHIISSIVGNVIKVTSLRRCGLGSRYLTSEDTHSFCSDATSHTHCNAVTLEEEVEEDIVIRQGLGRSRRQTGRWLHVDCHHTQRTESNMHTVVLPLSVHV